MMKQPSLCRYEYEDLNPYNPYNVTPPPNAAAADPSNPNNTADNAPHLASNFTGSIGQYYGRYAAANASTRHSTRAHSSVIGFGSVLHAQQQVRRRQQRQLWSFPLCTCCREGADFCLEAYLCKLAHVPRLCHLVLTPGRSPRQQPAYCLLLGCVDAVFTCTLSLWTLGACAGPASWAVLYLVRERLRALYHITGDLPDSVQTTVRRAGPAADAAASAEAAQQPERPEPPQPYVPQQREVVRDESGQSAIIVKDAVTVVCCPWCTVQQLLGELAARGEAPESCFCLSCACSDVPDEAVGEKSML